jgi:hypothetical protein
MELFDRYLKLVKFFLPRAQQDDIIRELSEDIQSQVEEKEAILGRPLNKAEQQELVGQLGHPALLAGRYGPRRQLIGAELFPFYWLVLRLALGANLLAQCLATAIALAGDRPVNPILRLVSAAFALFATFGVVTIVFAALDYSRPNAIFRRRWDPSRLSAETIGRVRRESHPISRLVWGVLFVAWWIAARRFPALVLGAGADVFRLGPVWDSVYFWILAFAGVSLANASLDLLHLIRPQRRGVHFAMKLIGGCGGLAVLLFLLTTGHFVVLANPAAASPRLSVALTVINQSIYWTLSVAALIVGVQTFRAVRWWRRDETGPTSRDGARVTAMVMVIGFVVLLGSAPAA